MSKSVLKNPKALKEMNFSFDPYSKFNEFKLAVAFVVCETRIGEVDKMLSKYKKFFENQVFKINCTGTTEG